MTTSAHEALGYLKGMRASMVCSNFKTDKRALDRVIALVELDVKIINDQWEEERR